MSPGCRNNWHIHHASKGGGQLLICTAGEGWYQEEGKARCQPAARQRHHRSRPTSSTGTAPRRDSWFSHIAVEVPGEDCNNEWCEPVSDEEYAKL